MVKEITIVSQANKYLISIIVPVFNEEENTDPFYRAVKEQLDQISEHYDYEFIFTDNRSTDSTFGHLTALAQSDERVKVARFSRNFGYQKSIFTGYCLAEGDCAIAMDCDLQDPPHLIHEFLAKWREGYEVVYGIRTSRKENWLMTQIRKGFYRLINLLADDHLPLNAGDFRLIDRKVLDNLKQLNDATLYLRGTIATLGFNQIGIPYDRAKRLRGKSKFGFHQMTSLALDGILNNSIVPLRCATFIGFLISGGLILYFGGLYVLTIFFHYTWPKGFATTSVLILISISLNALFLGIIGEYLGRIYRQTKGQPFTVIDQTMNLDHTSRKNRVDPEKPKKSLSTYTLNN